MFLIYDATFVRSHAPWTLVGDGEQPFLEPSTVLAATRKALVSGQCCVGSKGSCAYRALIVQQTAFIMNVAAALHLLLTGHRVHMRF